MKIILDAHQGFGSSRRKLRLVFPVCLLSCMMLACSWFPQAPVRVIPTPLPELAIETVEMPRRICIGDMAIFVVRTRPGNECGGSISYWNVHDSWVSDRLELTTTDEAGLCRWKWQVADDALPGEAEFRATAEAYGNSRMLIEHFRIEKCSK
jgi:hypothetical protein